MAMSCAAFHLAAATAARYSQRSCLVFHLPLGPLNGGVVGIFTSIGISFTSSSEFLFRKYFGTVLDAP